MSYTRNWSNAVPPGSRLAKEIDDAAREFRVDVHERLLTLLEASIDFDTDPWRLRADRIGPVAGNLVTRKLVFGPNILRPQNETDDVQFLGNQVISDALGTSMYATVPIPVGYKIKLFEAWVGAFNSTKAVVSLKRSTMTGSVVTDIVPDMERTLPSAGVLTSPALNYTTLDSEHYIINFRGESGGEAAAYSFRFTLEIPSLLVGY